MEQDKLMKWAAIVGTVYATATVVLMFSFRYSTLQGGLGSDSGYQKQMEVSTVLHAGREEEAVEKIDVKTGNVKSTAAIYLNKDLEEDSIETEFNYYTKSLYIYSREFDETSLAEYSLEADTGYVVSAGHIHRNGMAGIIIELKSVYECLVETEKDQIQIRFFAPRELYERIVVLDAGYGLQELTGESDIEEEGTVRSERAAGFHSAVCSKAAALLGDKGIKVYTVDSKNSVPKEDRVRLANEIGADAYIGVASYVMADGRENKIYTSYNGRYFIADFNSQMLADCLERNVAQSCQIDAFGILEAAEESALLEATVPAAVVDFHFPREENMVWQLEEGFEDAVAQGIVKAVEEMYYTRTEK